eukprot:762502-Hanusia_phi.AAC.3
MVEDGSGRMKRVGGLGLHSLVVMLFLICGPFYAPIIAQDVRAAPLLLHPPFPSSSLPFASTSLLSRLVSSRLVSSALLSLSSSPSPYPFLLFVSSSTSSDDLVLVQIVQNLDDWRATSQLSVAVCFVAMSWIYIFAINTPEEIGMKPDGKWVESTGIEYESLLDGKQVTLIPSLADSVSVSVSPAAAPPDPPPSPSSTPLLFSLIFASCFLLPSSTLPPLTSLLDYSVFLSSFSLLLLCSQSAVVRLVRSASRARSRQRSRSSHLLPSPARRSRPPSPSSLSRPLH